MGGSNGILIGLNLDPTAATEGLLSFEQALRGSTARASGSIGALSQSTNRVGASIPPVTRSMVELGDKTQFSMERAHEGARLLEVMLGLRLPRAVSTAIGTMMPELSTFLGVFLAGFAAEKLGEWGKALYDVMVDAEGTAKAVERLSQLGKENASILVSNARGSSAYAQEQLMLLNKQISAESEYTDTLRRKYDASNYVLGLYGMLLNKVGGYTKQLNDSETELNQTEQLRNDILKAMHEAEAGVEMDRKKKLIEAHNEVLRASLSGIALTQETTREDVEQLRIEQSIADLKDKTLDGYYQALIHEREIRGEMEAQKEIARQTLEFQRQFDEEGARWGRMLDDVLRDAKEKLKEVSIEMGRLRFTDMSANAPTSAFTPLVSGFHQLTAAEREQLPLAISTTNQMAMLTQRLNEQHREIVEGNLPAMKRIDLEYQRNIDAARRDAEEVRLAYQQKKASLSDYEAALVQLHQVEDAAGKARGYAIHAEHDKELEEAGQISSGIAGLIAGRRAQAGVEAAFEIAEGVRKLAEGTWPPNPAAILAAGMHFEAAAEYAKIAGTSSGHRGGGGGTGGGSSRSGGSYGGGGGNRNSNIPPASLAEGASGSRYGSPGSGIVVVHGSTDLPRHIYSSWVGWLGRRHDQYQIFFAGPMVSNRV